MNKKETSLDAEQDQKPDFSKAPNLTWKLGETFLNVEMDKGFVIDLETYSTPLKPLSDSEQDMFKNMRVRDVHELDAPCDVVGEILKLRNAADFNALAQDHKINKKNKTKR